jgi:hypothetical protein
MTSDVYARVTWVLDPCVDPPTHDGLVVTHLLAASTWRGKRVIKTPVWRLRVILQSACSQTGEPWTYRAAYVLEEHDPQNSVAIGDWVVRYLYPSHDQALAQLELLATGVTVLA